jgi:SNF2 family DNA or RNA helicase
LEDRIRRLEDQEKQLQLQSEKDKLAADRAVLDAEKQKFQEQQNAAAQATPPLTPLPSDAAQPQKSVRVESDSRTSGGSPTGPYNVDSYNVFYERLQSEGRWYDDDKYGYVWQPSEAERDESWRPYTDGHWAYTDRGWNWLSNERFGWAMAAGRK